MWSVVCRGGTCGGTSGGGICGGGPAQRHRTLSPALHSPVLVGHGRRLCGRGLWGVCGGDGELILCVKPPMPGRGGIAEIRRAPAWVCWCTCMTVLALSISVFPRLLNRHLLATATSRRCDVQFICAYSVSIPDAAALPRSLSARLHRSHFACLLSLSISILALPLSLDAVPRITPPDVVPTAHIHRLLTVPMLVLES